ncbi:HPr kinase/phosphorylase [Mesorhizobium sp. CA18]|uniref:HPr kinase/phosphorylase n=1 Tax=unclassified Mesorhizobium TaxID=325217 RepID=UPI001CCBBAAC|nr:MULTISPECIES: HPr kinase/phosphorylase [unclassified Mesorhizobium]MBZ9735303.1 HPr kinase/phosphorylase [Mesorhizobium sp. CA9]MBZ9825782.1 HPr kinase/phosphorylase [Mesorhizobium sp. CA18]MBZ9832809.1 HPr kinase/phosphorylase [Mesorhizobium sp. CA2]MBZ9839365.1 HPr kinase/phosphorylase [Mesorhizobium sp. CA3]MBZ9879773.1 HPr kinase/phosphorylase [Mesorhizobium sp. Ca11]
MPGAAAKPRNIHGTAILVGERGVLITGPSGAGKTTLALAVVDHCRAQGLFARLVGDDQLFAAAHSGRLVCRAPASIAGLAEVHGIGPRPLAFEPAAVIDLVARLVEPADMARLQDETTETIGGCRLPRVDVARQNVTAALPMLMARLSIQPFS